MKRAHALCLTVAVAGTLVVAAPTARSGTADDCLACHGDASITMERKGKTVSLFVDRAFLERSPHVGMECTDCHEGFDPASMPHAARILPVNCLTCHSDAPEKHPFHASLIEAAKRGIDPALCKACHGSHDIAPANGMRAAAAGPGKEGAIQTPHPGLACERCHGEIVRRYLESQHGRMAAAGTKAAPLCVQCHRHPLTSARTGGDLLVAKLEQEKLCLSCHRDDPAVRALMTPSTGFIAAYERSVHGAALVKGNAQAANCVDCHGAHSMEHGSAAGSQVNRAHIPETCAHCHAQIAEEYATSVHGAALKKGNKDAPVCTDCHGEHDILKHTDPNSPVAPRNVSARVCSPCHSSVRMSEKYGMDKDRPRSFADSYHGLAIRGGSLVAANCASCHGAHNILPSDNRASTVNRANLAKTCGKCHPGANDKFAVGGVHVVVTEAEEPALYWIATLYIGMIVLTIGGMAAHNALDFIRKSRRRIGAPREELDEEAGSRLYVRMTLFERLQHGALVLSFTVLALTGFMLHYPDAFWVVWLRSLGGSGVFELRSLLHRIAGVVMVASSLVHIAYVALSARGRALVRDLFPRRKDLHDLLGTLRYNVGLSAQKPRYERFSYVEKSEYWALIWGTMVMALTGAVMWFENVSIGILTKLGWDISRTIHFYEAWLATLAIIVWHLYYVIFNPDVYPMSTAWITGTVSEAEMREEHPLELEAIRRRRIEEESALAAEATGPGPEARNMEPGQAGGSLVTPENE